MKKLALAAVLVSAAMAFLFGGALTTARGVATHCPGHQSEAKFESSGVFDGTVNVNIDGPTVTFTDVNTGDPVQVQFCVKGGSQKPISGVISGSSYTHPQDISYVVVYGLAQTPTTPPVPEVPGAVPGVPAEEAPPFTG